MKYRKWLLHCKAAYWWDTGLEIRHLTPAPPVALAYDRGIDPEQYARQLVESLPCYWPVQHEKYLTFRRMVDAPGKVRSVRATSPLGDPIVAHAVIEARLQSLVEHRSPEGPPWVA